MMNFRTVKTKIEQILTAVAGDSFQVVGYQKQAIAASEILDNLRTVQVFYSNSDFPKSADIMGSDIKNDAVFRIELSVSKSAKADLSVLDDPNATNSQRAAALANYQNASNAADESFDELVDLVYQILMDPVNYELGLSVGTVTNRWINQVQKDQVIPSGEYVVLTGMLSYEIRINESTNSPILPADATIFDTTVDIDGDDIEKTGVITDLN
jgi:hypothetical protein